MSVYFLFQSNKEESKASYLTYRVSNKNIENSVVAKGVLFAKNQVDVGAQVTGQLIRLLVEEGQFVSKGQLLAEIDTTIAENQLMYNATLRMMAHKFRGLKSAISEGRS